MANVDKPFGLKPVGHLGGSSWNGKTDRGYVSANDATALYKGDPVIITATTADRESSGKYLTYERATAGNANRISAVVVAVLPDGQGSLQYRAASTARYLEVVTDPSVVYQIQDDGTVASTDNWPGANGVIIYTHSGSAYTGLSGVELDAGGADAPAADASNQLLILNLSRISGNALGAWAVWDVFINLHTYRSNGDGDGSLGILGA